MGGSRSAITASAHPRRRDGVRGSAWPRSAGWCAIAAAVALLPVRPTAADEAPPAPTTLEILRERVDFDLESDVAWAINTRNGNSQKLEWTLVPDVSARLPLEVDLRFVGRVRGDVFDRLEPGIPDQDAVALLDRRWFPDPHWQLELRELYAERRFERVYLKVGKQQVVWGQADGLKVLDVVNPQVWREFILPDFDESRIPLWTLNAEFPIGETLLQLLWIPDPTYHDFPNDPSSVYFITTPLVFPVPPPGTALAVTAPDRPGGLGEISDAGARLSGFTGGWDWTLNYLFHYDDTPAFLRQIVPAPGQPVALVTPTYERTQLAGGSFANAFGDLTVRGELAYSFRKFLPNADPLDGDGVTRTDEFGYVLGLDWFGFRETLISAQIFQSVITNRPPGVFRDRLESVVTLLVRRELLNDRLTLECAWLQGINRGDGLVRPRARFEVRDEVAVYGGFDVFYGDGLGLFGQFDQNTRFVLGVEVGLTDLF